MGTSLSAVGGTRDGERIFDSAPRAAAVEVGSKLLQIADLQVSTSGADP
jgi:hypothetical protein